MTDFPEERKAFLASCVKHGLEAGDLDLIFVHAGEAWRIVGLKPRARDQRVILAQLTGSDRLMRLTAKTVLTALARMPGAPPAWLREPADETPLERLDIAGATW